MNRQIQRRQARAIAISATDEANRKRFVVRAMAALTLVLGVFEAFWTAHHVLLVR